MNQDTRPFPVHEGMLTLNLVRETEGETSRSLRRGGRCRSQWGTEQDARALHFGAPCHVFRGEKFG